VTDARGVRTSPASDPSNPVVRGSAASTLVERTQVDRVVPVFDTADQPVALTLQRWVRREVCAGGHVTPAVGVYISRATMVL
jgi:hypothetical protein